VGAAGNSGEQGHLKNLFLVVLFVSAGAPAGAELCWGTEPARQPCTDGAPLGEMSDISTCRQAQFAETDQERSPTSGHNVEAYYCSCYDKPNKHYPYSIVVLRTPNGDLVARPEGTDGVLSFTPLAIRYGNRYCEVGSEQNCYGSFSHPCDFTDFRYGPYLAEFFPTCMSE